MKKIGKRLCKQIFFVTLHSQSRRRYFAFDWKGAGVVDRGGLENRCTLAGTQGSNPCLSATLKDQNRSKTDKPQTIN